MSETMKNWVDWLQQKFIEWFTDKPLQLSPQPGQTIAQMSDGYRTTSNTAFFTLKTETHKSKPLAVVRHRIPRSPSTQHPFTHREIRHHRVEVKPQSSLWQDRGWVKNGNKWCGVYCVGRRSWQGSAVPTRGGALDMYIQDPPRSLLNGPHGRCYVYKGNDKGHWVHFDSRTPKNLSQAIGAIEYHISHAL